MPIPSAFLGRMRLPAIAAPMFLVSGPELVIAACQAGVAGSFPALNARDSATLDAWLTRIGAAQAAAARCAPSMTEALLPTTAATGFRCPAWACLLPTKP